jgi:hypothetical protein
MDKTKLGVLAATAILGLGALGGAAVKANASGSPVISPTPPVAAAVGVAPEADAGLPDTDTLQQGDQTAADTAAGATADNAVEAAGEQTGSETAGNDGPGGHADEPGNANADHQFEGAE